MDGGFVFAAELLTPEDVSSLRQLGPLLRMQGHAIAVEWSRRVMDRLPEYFASGELSAAQLAGVNEGFLTLVIDHLDAGDLQGLFETYYRRNRDLIEADLQRAPALRISLDSLYVSARLSVQVIGEHLRGHDIRLLLAYTKLTAELMMIVSQAYNDAREEYLQRAFEQINTLSHELRAPLASLFGYLELLRAGDFGPVSAKQEQVLSQLIRESDDLLWLLTGTLDLSRLDTGRVEVRVEEFPLDALFAEVLRVTPHANVTVRCSVPAELPLMRTDRVKLKQVLGNLLRNAVRYGGAGTVTLAATLPRPDAVELSVRDLGPGIKPEDLQIIFDFFTRGHGAGLARDGYGIGLHVVRRLVALLGGTVAVQSSPGAGSTFRVTLPVQPPAAAARHRA
jgi:signal transduction histidine kinase